MTERLHGPSTSAAGGPRADDQILEIRRLRKLVKEREDHLRARDARIATLEARLAELGVVVGDDP